MVYLDRRLGGVERRRSQRDARNAQVSRAQDYAARRRTVARAQAQEKK